MSRSTKKDKTLIVKDDRFYIPQGDLINSSLTNLKFPWIKRIKITNNKSKF